MPLQTPPAFGGLAQTFLTVAKTAVVTAFYAPVGTAITANIGYNNLWLPIGILKPGSFKPDVSKKLYDVKTGIPETIQQSFATEVMGKFACEIIEPSHTAVELANGGDPGTPYFSGTPLSDTVATGGMTVADTVPLTTGGAWKAGDEFQIVTPNGTEYSRVVSYNSGTKTITCYPRLSANAAAAATVKRVDGWDEPLGTSTVKTNALMFVADHTDLSQTVFEVMKARTAGFKANLPQGQEEGYPIEFGTYGMTVSGYNGPVVAQLHTRTAGNTITWNT